MDEQANGEQMDWGMGGSIKENVGKENEGREGSAEPFMKVCNDVWLGSRLKKEELCHNSNPQDCDQCRGSRLDKKKTVLEK